MAVPSLPRMTIPTGFMSLVCSVRAVRIETCAVLPQGSQKMGTQIFGGQEILFCTLNFLS